MSLRLDYIQCENIYFSRFLPLEAPKWHFLRKKLIPTGLYFSLMLLTYLILSYGLSMLLISLDHSLCIPKTIAVNLVKILVFHGPPLHLRYSILHPAGCTSVSFLAFVFELSVETKQASLMGLAFGYIPPEEYTK